MAALRFRFAPPAASHGAGGNLALTINTDHSVGAGQAVVAGKTIRVNGQYFDHIRRIGVFALIYEGAPNWGDTDAVVRLNVPGQPEIEVRMGETGSRERLCGIVLIDNVAGELKMSRMMRFYPSQKPFADDIVYLQWQAVGRTEWCAKFDASLEIQ